MKAALSLTSPAPRRMPVTVSLLAGAALLLWPLSSLAQNAGADLAAKGAEGAPACVGCHGAQGEGNGPGGFPRLAGQPHEYLLRQLAAYADGRRHNPVMEPIAKALSPVQRAAVARYYAGLEAPPQAAAQAASAPSPAAAQRGQTLALHGDDGKQVQACANCHGPQGAGQSGITPYLAGQHAGYLTAAMGEWRDGTRNTDASRQMPHIARALSPADVEALAQYYAALPAPASLDAPAARWASTEKAKTSGPVGGNPQGGTQGVGSEQGTPLTGGGIGPGGGGASRESGRPGAPAAPARPASR